jgi:hypothetical protein
MTSQSSKNGENPAIATMQTVPNAAVNRLPLSEIAPVTASVPQRPNLSHRIPSKGTSTRSRTADFSPPLLSSYSSTEDDDSPVTQPSVSIAGTIAAPEPRFFRPQVLLVEDNMINLKVRRKIGASLS